MEEVQLPILLLVVIPVLAKTYGHLLIVALVQLTATDMVDTIAIVLAVFVIINGTKPPTV